MSTASASDRWTPITLHNHAVADFRATPNGILTIAAGPVRASYRLNFKNSVEEEWTHAVLCQVRLADDQGRVWQAESVFSADLFVRKLIDLSRPLPAVWIDHAPQEWQDAFPKQTILRRVSAAYDDRDYRVFYLDNTAFVVRFKYQGIYCDLAPLGDGGLLVRIFQLFGNWNPLPVEDADGQPLPPPWPAPFPVLNEEEEPPEGRWGDTDNLEPPLIYAMSARELMFCNTANFISYDAWSVGVVPTPPVFEPVGYKRTSNSTVRFRHRPQGLGVGDTAGDADKFTSIVLENEPETPGSVWWITRTGGTLRAEIGRLQMAVRLERVSGRESEAFDVLRCRMRVADAQGNLWEAWSHCTPEVFLEYLIDLVRGSWLSVDVNTGPDSLVGLSLVTGLRGMIADGGCRRCLIADTLLTVPGVDQHF